MRLKRSMNLPPPNMRSIRQRLLWLTSIFALLLGAVLLTTGYRTALHESNEILDAQMRFLAEHSAGQQINTGVKTLNIGNEYHEQNFRLEISPILTVGRRMDTGFYNREFDGKPWRSYILLTKEHRIEVSQSQQVRQRFALELAGIMLLPYVLILPIALWLLNWIIAKGLAPLDQFKNEIVQRDSQDLSAINHNEYPIELHATIIEMNRLLERILRAQQEQQQFVADAAHELRTPITALNLQAQLLLSQFPEHRALHGLNQGLARIQHLVAQLLALARQDSGLSTAEPLQRFQLNHVALNCVEQLMNVALQKNLDLGFSHNQSVQIYSEQNTLHSIIFNLLDNAIKYSPTGGVINIAIFKDDQNCATLMVEDSGPGIAVEQYDQVLQRFYRVHHHLEMGSGLGLSIVQRACQRLGAQLTLGKSEELGGLKVQIKLPEHFNRDDIE